MWDGRVCIYGTLEVFNNFLDCIYIGINAYKGYNSNKYCIVYVYITINALPIVWELLYCICMENY